MAIGLPLFQLLNKNQFCAVVAHEFGHYCAGDTILSPLLYRTRIVLRQTIKAMQCHYAFLGKPFIWYSKLFFYMTDDLSQKQEFAADRFAAKCYSSQALIESLVLIEGSSKYYSYYIGKKVFPVIQQGGFPPISEGFLLFLQSPVILEMTKDGEDESKEGASDSHPPLNDRMDSVQDVQSCAQFAGDNDPVIQLLGSVDSLERKLMEIVLGSSNIHLLKPVRWDS